jgi:hypothetical protein
MVGIILASKLDVVFLLRQDCGEMGLDHFVLLLKCGILNNEGTRGQLQ